MSKGVFCYRNLNRRGVVWSVRSNKTGLVIHRSELVILKDVELKVSEAGRARVLKQKRKNVHAGAKGTLVQDKNFFLENLANQEAWIRISYDPYKAGYFTENGGRLKINKAKYVILRHDGAWASRTEYV